MLGENCTATEILHHQLHLTGVCYVVKMFSSLRIFNDAIQNHIIVLLLTCLVRAELNQVSETWYEAELSDLDHPAVVF